MSQDSKVRQMLAAYVGAGVTLALITEFATAYHSTTLLGWLLLPLLALTAEFLPVSISRNGLRITFSLPFLAGMAVAVGPTGSLLTDLLVSLVAAVVMNIARRAEARPFWIGLNLAISGISASCAGLLFAAVSGAGGAQHTTLSALAYTATYAIVNFLLVSKTEALLTRTRLSERVTATAAIAAQGMVLYCLASIAVAVFVSKSLFILAPLILLPIIVLRQVLKLRAQMYDQYYETVTALTLMLQRAHPYTHGHLERVSRISEEVALRLGLPAARARLVREASVLHDIGKIAVDEEVLDKPAKLTPEEFAHVKRHSQLGAQILAPVETLRDLVPWIKHHHERPDGSGYPDGLSDLEIPIESKIIAVVDAFDAMTGGDEPSDRRPYREPMTTDAALSELDRCSGSQFDSRVVQAFRVVLGSGVV